jgi:glycosyltransferase involved in cell wall biosynthesis
MSGWISEAEAVISVDSGSEDGTVEFLKNNLTHVNFSFIQHPPGLYENWNAAIAKAQTKYVYIATSGDSISKNGLKTLYEAAEANNADVVVSPPLMVDICGRKQSTLWPIHRVLDTIRVSGMAKLSAQQMLLANLACYPGTLIGSSASNLYRTDLLQNKPFPTDVGREGDSAWAIEYGNEVDWVILTEPLAKFLIHGKNSSVHTKSNNRIRFLRTYRLYLERIKENELLSDKVVNTTNGLLSTLEQIEHLRLKAKSRQRERRFISKFLYKQKIGALKKSLPEKRDRVLSQLMPHLD